MDPFTQCQDWCVLGTHGVMLERTAVLAFFLLRLFKEDLSDSVLGSALQYISVCYNALHCDNFHTCIILMQCTPMQHIGVNKPYRKSQGILFLAFALGLCRAMLPKSAGMNEPLNSLPLCI